MFALIAMTASLHPILSLANNQPLEIEPFVKEEQVKKSQIPEYLYKVVSLEDWKKSQSQIFVVLSKDDTVFVHLAQKNQLDSIIEKFWSHASGYVVLEVSTSQLLGRLVYEANPGGTNKYYHLYEGSIPLNSVLEAKEVRK